MSGPPAWERCKVKIAVPNQWRFALEIVLDKAGVRSVGHIKLVLLQAAMLDGHAGGLVGLHLAIQEDVFHFVLLVPNSLLHDLSQSTNIKALKGLEVNTESRILMMTEKSTALGKVLSGASIERGLVGHGLQHLSGGWDCKTLLLHSPPNFSHKILDSE